MANVLVFGHQNPDNDAIMSSVVLSQLLNQIEYQGNTYTACCLGSLPAESAKLLEDAGVSAHADRRHRARRRGRGGPARHPHRP